MDGHGHIGIVHQVVGDDHYVLGVAGIGQGITQRAADGFGILGAGIAAGVAQFIGRRSTQELPRQTAMDLMRRRNLLVYLT